jgi:cyclophilin family peptidyl-prolyl cis-trans isomerase
MKRTLTFSLAALILLAGFSVFADGQKGTDKKMTQDKPKQTENPLAAKRAPIRNKANKFVTLETSMGKLTLELYHDVAPGHADSFLALTHKGFYNGTKFHRIIDNFMIQGGDPLGNGTGGAGYNLKAEFSDLPHEEGTLSMARAQDPNSASSQFFVCLGPAHFLDHQYTVFGHLIKGYDVLHAIGKVPVAAGPGGEKSTPVKEVLLVKAYESNADGVPTK